MAPGELPDATDDLGVGVEHVLILELRHAVGALVLGPLGEDAVRERAERGAGDALVEQHRVHLLLLLAVDEVVHVLHGDELGPAAALGDHVHLQELPGVHGAGADVEHLAGSHEVVQRLHLLLHGSVVVEAVRDVEVDVVGAEALERGVDLAEERLAVDALGVGAVVHGVVALGGDDRIVAHAHLGDDLAEDLLGGAEAVVVCRVEEVDALVPGVADDLARLVHSSRSLNARAFSLKTCQRARFLNARSVYPAVARTSKPHAAKADAAYVESGVAKSRVLHGLLSSVASSLPCMPMPTRALPSSRPCPWSLRRSCPLLRDLRPHARRDSCGAGRLRCRRGPTPRWCRAARWSRP